MADGNTERRILHIDMNAFYCSCHAAADPVRYAGRPTAVAGSPQTRHGVVVTASYEARKHGVRATMTVAEALRACRSLILIEPDFDLYRSYARRVFALVREYTPLVEVFSIDECWADVTGSAQFGSPLAIARTIQSRLQSELGLPSSIGIGPNKFLAKMASDFHKPLGITELWLRDVPDKLWPLPVREMFGVGEQTARRLERLGITTIGGLANAPPERLTRMLGKRGLELARLANGIDTSPVQPEPEPVKSVGHSITLSRDLTDIEQLATVLMNLADQVGRRARRHGLAGRTVQITIRYSNRQTCTRARTLDSPTALTETIFATARWLLEQHLERGRPVRLLGVTLTGLAPTAQLAPESRQLHLFQPDSEADREARLAALSQVTDRLRDKYGESIVVRGRMLERDESSQIRDHKRRGTSLQKDNLD